MFGDIKSLKNFLNNPPAQLTAMFTGERRAFPTKENSCAALRKNTYQ